MKAIEASGLCKNYGSVVALDDVSFSVEKGEVIGLLGPNGAGKTTLMKILTGYLQPDSGDAEVAGSDVIASPLVVQEQIGYLPESAPLYHDMAVQEYLTMIAELRGVAIEKRRERLSDAIHATGLEDYLTRRIGNLSKGYRQRVGIAQAIVHRPDLLILDEPTTGLDPNQIVDIRDLIKKLSEHSTVMLSTHILPEVEMTCERVLMIANGKLRADSKVADLQANNASIIAIDKSAKQSEVKKALSAVKGVEKAEPKETEGDFVRWRVTSDSKDDLCPALFEAVKEKDWRVAELRNDTRTLESVFRELAADGGKEKRS
jgi:ABC-2 type transport system ATP-binding protein